MKKLLLTNRQVKALSSLLSSSPSFKYSDLFLLSIEKSVCSALFCSFFILSLTFHLYSFHCLVVLVKFFYPFRFVQISVHSLPPYLPCTTLNLILNHRFIIETLTTVIMPSHQLCNGGWC